MQLETAETAKAKPWCGHCQPTTGGQRVDRRHAVDGTIYLETGGETSQRSYNMKPVSEMLLAALLICATAWADDIRTERVHFNKGANSATVQGTVKGYETVDYLLGARKGQSMNVSMATDNTSNYFNIIAPGAGETAMFVGSTSGSQYEGTLPATGDYKVRVYLMRNAARRNEVAKYRLEMIID